MVPWLSAWASDCIWLATYWLSDPGKSLSPLNLNSLFQQKGIIVVSTPSDVSENQMEISTVKFDK